MKRYFLLFVFLAFSCADSVDNAVLQDLNNTSQKSAEDNTQDSKDSIESTSKESEIKPNLESNNEDKKTITKTTDKKWFIGGYFGTNYNAKYKNEDVQTFSASLHGGLSYNVAINHGLRGYIFASFNSISKYTIYSLGAGIDYFYMFKGGIKIFGGLYADMPINSDIIKSVDVAIYGGVGANLNKNNHIDLRIGYPMLRDNNFAKSMLVGIGYQYTFGK